MGALLRRFMASLMLLKVKISYLFFGIEAVSVFLTKANSNLTTRVLKRYGASIGVNTNMKGCLHIDNASGDEDATGDYRNLILGNKCYIGKNVFFDLPNKIIIHDEAIISAGVTILTHSDCGNRYMSRHFPRKTAPVEIGKGSWIGANSTILCGIKVGKGVVIGAASLVTTDVPDDSIYAGVPAKFVRKVEQ